MHLEPNLEPDLSWLPELSRDEGLHSEDSLSSKG